MFIYQLRNKTNGKSYVGQTIRPLEERWAAHCRDAKTSEFAIHRAIRKYGPESFERILLATASTPVELNALEVSYIEQLNTFGNGGYNQTIGGNTVMGRRRHSLETRQKISLLQKGRKQSPELVAKRTKHQIGKPLSENHKRKISEAQRGRAVSLERRAKLSLANKGKKHSVETRSKMSMSQSTRKRSPYRRCCGYLDDEVCRLAADGMSQRAIAKKLCVSRGIVRRCARQ